MASWADVLKALGAGGGKATPRFGADPADINRAAQARRRARQRLAAANADAVRLQQRYAAAQAAYQQAQADAPVPQRVEAEYLKAQAAHQRASAQRQAAQQRHAAAVAKYRKLTTPLTPAQHRADRWGAALDAVKGLGADIGLGGTVRDATGVGSVGDAAGLALDVGRAAAGDPTAIASLVKRGVKWAADRPRVFKEGLGHLGAAAGSQRAGDIGANLLRAGSKFAASTGAVGPALALGAAAKLADAVENLRRFNDRLLEANFELGKFSGAMAGVEAEKLARDIELSVLRGERRAGATGDLARSQARVNQELSPYEDVWNVAILKIQKVLTDSLYIHTLALGELSGMRPAFTAIADQLGLGSNTGFDAGEFLAVAGNADWARRHGVPQWADPNGSGGDNALGAAAANYGRAVRQGLRLGNPQLFGWLPF